MPRLKINSTHLLYLFFAVFFSAAFVRCASIAAPQGGPRDSLPPLIVSTSPLQRSVNFDGRRIILNFNEYIQLRDQQKEFLMSPVLERRPSLVVKGRSLEVEFEDYPEPNTTYRLDFGTSIADNNEGNKLGEYAFIFSSGPELDTLMMSGIVIDAQTRDTVVGALVFFYYAEQDSLPAYDSTLFNAQARAVFRSDSSGQFLADILQDRFYRIYAIKDENGNQKYEAGSDYVGILDAAYNPTELPDFDIWIDPAEGRRTPRRRIVDPQLRIELFKEEAVRRQTILGTARPERQQLQIVFNAPQAEILSFNLSGIDSTWLLQERGIRGDTVWYWIAPPTLADVEALRDTIRGEITYITQDSLWQLTERTENVTFTHRIVDPNSRGRNRTPLADSIKQAKKEARQAKKLAKLQKKWLKKARKISRRRGDPPRPDSVLLKDSTLFQQVKVDTTLRETVPDELLPRPNPFRYTVQASNPLNPEKDIQLFFNYPLRSIDSTRISLVQISAPATEQPGTRRSMPGTETQPAEALLPVELPVPFAVEVDSLSVERHVTIKADWVADMEYKLLIPDSVFVNIAFEHNDTLASTFKVADFNRYGTIILEIGEEASAPGSEYIVEVMTRDLKPVARFVHVLPGETFTVRYLPPGDYRIRITEDLNGNGEWDTGSLVQRRQPERIRFYNHPEAGPDIMAKENWEVPITLDLPEIFSQP